MHSVRNDEETPANGMENVRTQRMKSRMQDSPYTAGNETSKPIGRWRKVNVNNGDVYVPWNVPVEAPGRMFEFRLVESAGEAIAPSVEGERACDGNGNGSGGDGDDGGVGDVDSKRVKVVLLTGDSQHMRQIQRTRDGNVPVSSVPPSYLTECPFGPVRCCH